MKFLLSVAALVVFCVILQLCNGAAVLADNAKNHLPKRPLFQQLDQKQQQHKPRGSGKEEAATKAATSSPPHHHRGAPCNPIDSPADNYCKPGLECCGDDTMFPSCFNSSKNLQCCTWWLAAAVCTAKGGSATCCGALGTGASSSAFCCPPPTFCCPSVEDGESQCCSGTDQKCCRNQNSWCCDKTKDCCGQSGACCDPETEDCCMEVCCNKKSQICCGDLCCDKETQVCVDGKTCQWKTHAPSQAPPGPHHHNPWKLLYATCSGAEQNFFSVVADESSSSSLSKAAGTTSSSSDQQQQQQQQKQLFFCTDPKSMSIARLNINDGSVKWNSTIPQNANDGNNALFLQQARLLYYAGAAFDPETGKLAWQLPQSDLSCAQSTTTLFQDGDTLVLHCFMHERWTALAFDTRNRGQRSWIFAFPSGFFAASNSPNVVDHTFLMVAGANSDYFVGVDIPTGKMLFNISLNGSVNGWGHRHRPLLVYPIPLGGSFLTMYNARTGATLWTAKQTLSNAFQISKKGGGYAGFVSQDGGSGVVTLYEQLTGKVQWSSAPKKFPISSSSPPSFVFAMANRMYMLVPNAEIAAFSLSATTTQHQQGADTDGTTTTTKVMWSASAKNATAILESAFSPFVFLVVDGANSVAVLNGATGAQLHLIQLLPEQSAQQAFVSDDLSTMILWTNIGAYVYELPNS